MPTIKHKILGYVVHHWVAGDILFYSEYFSSLIAAQDEYDLYPHNENEWPTLQGYYLDENNDYIFIDLDYITDDCYYFEDYDEYLTDAECDRYAVEVMNGDGYYDDNGNFHYYSGWEFR